MGVSDQVFLKITTQVERVDFDLSIWSARTFVSLNRPAIVEFVGTGYTSQWSYFVENGGSDSLAEAVCYVVDDNPLEDLNELFYILDAFGQDTSTVAGRLRRVLIKDPSIRGRTVERFIVFDSVFVEAKARGLGLAELAAAHCLFHAGCWSSTTLAASIPGARVPDAERSYVVKRAEHLLGKLGFALHMTTTGPLYLIGDSNASAAVRAVVAWR
jgi:hypothetical protein